MTTSQNVDEFLEHFGTAGMKWGVRKPKSARTETQKSHAARMRKRKERIQTGAVIGGIAGIMVLNILSQSGRRRVDTDFSSRFGSPNVPKSAADIINSQREVKLKALRRTFREGHMDKDQLTNFTSLLNRRYDRRVSESSG